MRFALKCRRGGEFTTVLVLWSVLIIRLFLGPCVGDRRTIPLACPLVLLGRGLLLLQVLELVVLLHSTIVRLLTQLKGAKVIQKVRMGAGITIRTPLE